MQEILESCAGLDVHQNSIVGCIMKGHGKKMYKEIKSFGTMTEDIESLGDWLKKNEIKDIAMESTGIYWKPIFNVLDENFNLTLANPKMIKNVPGRKTDVKDSEWICQIFKCGLVPKSFVPPEKIRHLRDVTRYRRALTRNLSTYKNRLTKQLESSNIKLASVFTNIYGSTAWKIIKLIADGETDINELTAHIPKQVKANKSEIRKALKGTLKDRDLDLIKLMIKEIEQTQVNITEIEKLIDNALKDYESEIKLLKTIPGISDTSAAVILAEMGNDTSQFPSANHLTSWAGMTPGHKESAGKKKSTKINPGNNFLKIILIQTALAAVKSKNTFYQAKYKNLIIRKGHKKAIIAIGRKILALIYHVLDARESYEELGAEYLDKRLTEKKIAYYKKQLEALEKNVNLTDAKIAIA